MTETIYILSDPRTDEIRYVGKTTRVLARRLREHLQAAGLKKHTHKTHWLLQLKELGLKPLIEEVEVTAVADEAEMFWIEQFRALGFKLVNSTVGGEGRRCGSKLPAETRAKMSAIHMGKKRIPFTDLHKANIATARARQQFTAETRAKMGKSHEKVRPFIDQYGRIYQTQAEAARAHNLNSGAVFHVLSGKHAQAKGFIFKYLVPSFPSDLE